MQKITKRLLIWAVIIVLLLLIPVWGNMYVDGWSWSPFDFLFIGVLLFGTAATYELVSRKFSNGTYRLAVGLAVITALVMIWINAAVHIIGDDEWPNFLYLGVIAISFLSAILVRFKPKSMSRILLGMAIALMLVPCVALIIANQQMMQEPGVAGVFMLTAFFAVLFAGSGLLFRQAALKQA